MSAVLFKDDILFLQRILASAGFYKGPLNGTWTAAVDKAETDFNAESQNIKSQLGEFDPRSEGNIMTLLPAAQRTARQFLSAVAGGPLTYKIISGTRTYAEQEALYKIGRTIQKDRGPVTNARGGKSNHNFAIAWDVGIFEGGKYYTGASKKEEKAYADLGKLIKVQVPNIEWGGDWTSFVDMPHYQHKTGKSVSEIAALLKKGKTYA